MTFKATNIVLLVRLNSVGGCWAAPSCSCD